MSKKSKVWSMIGKLSENTQKGYVTAIRLYEEFHGMNIDELVCEALDEQTQQVPPHMLKVIDRIESFQEYLIEKGHVIGTVRTYMGKIKTIYKKCRVVLPYLEELDPKQVRRREYIEFKDMLTKDEIKEALSYMLPPARARAIAMVQGGLSNEECEHFTTRQFIDDLYKYHQCDNDIDALAWLSSENNPVIWVAKCLRIKTKKPYYAIIGAEAVYHIARAKLYEKELPKNHGNIPEKLFTNNKKGFGATLLKLNKKLGFGQAGEEARLKPHNLRKFHATYISGSALNYEEHSLITNAEIDEMQGRGKTAVQDTYIKSNPIRQKALYAKVMNNVSLYHEYDFLIKDHDVIVSVVNLDEKNKNLENEVKILSEKLENKERASQKVNALRNELGDDVLLEMVQEILNTS